MKMERGILGYLRLETTYNTHLPNANILRISDMDFAEAIWFRRSIDGEECYTVITPMEMIRKYHPNSCTNQIKTYENNFYQGFTTFRTKTLNSGTFGPISRAYPLNPDNLVKGYFGTFSSFDSYIKTMMDICSSVTLSWGKRREQIKRFVEEGQDPKAVLLDSDVMKQHIFMDDSSMEIRIRTPRRKNR